MSSGQLGGAAAVGLGCGLALLNASAFYLPMDSSVTFPMDSSVTYWLPDLSMIVMPSVLAVALLTPLAALLLLHVDRTHGGSTPLTLTVVAILCCIAVLSGFSAAGYTQFQVLT